MMATIFEYLSDVCREAHSSYPSHGTSLFSKDLSNPEVGVELGTE